MSDVAKSKIVLIVKGLKSKLPKGEMDRRYKERMPRFRELEGLLQKFYSYDEATGEWAGIYLWESQAALDVYLASDLRSSIPSAYELVGKPQVERFSIIDVLRT